ncbi:hypothetical protein H8M03_07490 [Sphingomonas sabuli]|uniref:Uncharacterized protein n=1 Tax=Sphingomonas sabuli TaxID=2764186 RepID=A0A7G9KZU1_9SPHN|nr:DUF6445 family protein [Sphingomonas sabuli]QNM81890.1 hypothetical protein H8M03_07490 [Sphingomonas sabuli]
MRPSLHRFGDTQSAVVAIDEFSGDAGAIAALADDLAPFPPVDHGYYPGVRRVIGSDDGAAWDYARKSCEAAAPFIAGAFGIERFELVEASFSIVCSPPEKLRVPQRAPHFDTTEQDYIALLHYLRIPAPSGTAFFRQRSTRIERIDDANVDRFVAFAEAEGGKGEEPAGYIQGSNAHFEQIGAVDAVPDRMVIYQGSLLHSGIITDAMPLTPDTRTGRLTANFFVRGQ